MPCLYYIPPAIFVFMAGIMVQDHFKLIRSPATQKFITNKSRQHTIKITRIKDGDSLVGHSVDGFEIEIRLAHIDAPERYQDFGEQARQELVRLCFNKNAALSGSKKDGYGRLLATVTCGNVHVNQHMLETGHAWVYDKYNAHLTFPALEKKAAENCAGLWGQSRAVPPWVYRKKVDYKYSETSRAEIAARTGRCAKLTLAERQ